MNASDRHLDVTKYPVLIALKFDGGLLLCSPDECGRDDYLWNADRNRTLLDLPAGDWFIHCVDGRNWTRHVLLSVSPSPSHEERDLKFNSVRACIAHLRARMELAMVNAEAVVRKTAPWLFRHGKSPFEYRKRNLR